jgi:hypothetical protein
MPALAAEITPVLLMPPKKVVISPTSMPTAAVILPVLTMPPPGFDVPKAVTVKGSMPISPAEMVPLLAMAPAKVETP